MTQKPLAEKLREKLAFKAQVLPYEHFPIRMMQNPELPERDEKLDLINDYLDEAMRFSKLTPYHEAMIEAVAEAIEMRNRMESGEWLGESYPGECFDSALNKLKELCGE